MVVEVEFTIRERIAISGIRIDDTSQTRHFKIMKWEIRLFQYSNMHGFEFSLLPKFDPL